MSRGLPSFEIAEISSSVVVASWPAFLQGKYRAHLAKFNATGFASKADLQPSVRSISVMEAVMRVRTAMRKGNAEDPSENDRDDCFVCFVLDGFEACCSCSLLTSSERQLMTGPPKKVRVASRKARNEDDITYLQSTSIFARELDAVFLLRFMASLPTMLSHYNVLNGGGGSMAGPGAFPAFEQRVPLFLKCLSEVLQVL